MKLVLSLAGALLVSSAASAVPQTTAGSAADPAAQRRLEADVRFLADDLLEGRATPSRGLDLAALYLANQLRAAGWAPAKGDSYLQTHKVGRFTPAGESQRVSLNGIELASDEYLLLSGPVPRQQLVFCGHCVFLPERGVDDFAGIDVSGKAALALLGAPWPLDPAGMHGPDRLLGKDVSATVRGARLLVYVSEELAAAAGAASAEIALWKDLADGPIVYLSDLGERPSSAIGGVLVLTPAAFDRTLAESAGGSYAALQRRLAGGANLGRPLAATVEVAMEGSTEEATASNVVAALRGSDPARRDEWVVLSAHFDHVGQKAVPAGQDGIFNGADDNASGTAAVLEVARRLAEGPRPPRSVLVLLTAGEEMGLLGSAHYAFNPLVAWSQVVAGVNADMVGRSRRGVVAETPGSQEMFELAAEIGRRRGTEVRPDPTPLLHLTYFVDAYHFARSGVPAVTFSTEFHADYHQPSDEADKIRYPGLARITDVIAGVVAHYAGDVPRPRFERPAWFLTPPEPRAVPETKGGTR